MRARSLALLLLGLLIAAQAEAQKKKKKPPQPPARTCQDGKPAAQDGSCPEDFVRTCQDGKPAAEDGSCPEDTATAPPAKFYEIPFKITANIDLAAVSVDELEVGQTPLDSTARIKEGPHVLGVIFPGFDAYTEDITVDEDLRRSGYTRSLTLVPTKEEARPLLDSDDEIKRFLGSGLTVDGYVAYTEARKIRNFGLIVLGGSVAAFGGFTTAFILLEDNRKSPAVTLPFTLGVISLLVGAPAYGVGRLRVQKAREQRRDDEFQIKPPAAPAPPEPTTAPATAPASAPASGPK